VNLNEEDKKYEPEAFWDGEGKELSDKTSFSYEENRSDSSFLSPDGQIPPSILHEKEEFSNGSKRGNNEIVTTKNCSYEEELWKNVDGSTLVVGTNLCNFKVNNDNISSNGEDNINDSKEPKLKETVEKLMTEKSLRRTLIPSANVPITINLLDNLEDWDDDCNEPGSSLLNLFSRNVIDEQTLPSRLQNKEESTIDSKRNSNKIVTISNDGDEEVSGENLIQSATISPVDEILLNYDIPLQYVASQVDNYIF